MAEVTTGGRCKESGGRIKRIVCCVSCMIKHLPFTAYRLPLFLLLAVHCLLSTVTCFAGEPPAVITSDSLEHEEETSTYTAKGSVKVQKAGTTIEANEMIYNEKTSDVFAEGDVRYNEPEISLKAEKAVYNLDAKTGIFYNAEIFSKRDNFHISGTEIEKRGEREYFLKKASLTTCDAPFPAWCFKGRNVDIVMGDRLKARDVTFNIRGAPALYTPYLWAPIVTERKTGFLMPVLGYSKAKSFHYGQPFFWAIDEDKDATFILDWYSKRGFGKGIEYRYVGLDNVEGKHWLYHIKDKKTGKNVYELRSAHDKRNAQGASAYINLNLLNERSFYREYSAHSYERIKRFLESTAEISMPSDNSRLYLMSQYNIDLKDGSHSSTVAQRLPEVGYVVNPYSVGRMLFSFTSSASTYWRDEGVSGKRVDISPRFSHFFGDEVIIFQNLGLRTTAYRLHNNETDGFERSIRRDTFDYNITASSRILKKYRYFTHAVEPSIGYTYVPWLKKDKINLPLFDSTDIYSRQSTATFSVINRIFNKQGEFFTLSLSESYNSYEGDRAFSPIGVAAAITRPIQIRGDITYNTYSGLIENVNSAITMNIFNAAVSLGERRNRVQNSMFFDLAVVYGFSNLSTEGNLWYDAKGGGVRDATLKLKYRKQCWGVTVITNRKPGDEATGEPSDYSIAITFDLLGVGSHTVWK